MSIFDTLTTVSKSAEQKRKQPLAMSTVSFAKITSSCAAVNGCPSEMIDQIGGWSSGKVGEGYGEGFSVLQTAQWMTGLSFTLWKLDPQKGTGSVPLRIIASFWLLLWCSFLLPLSTSQVDAHEKNKTPCQIDVIFEDDQAGVATYFVLRLQHKNQSRRIIEAVSVLVRDPTDKIIRNSDAICGDSNEGIDAGDTGQCEKVLQIITGKLSNKVGYDTWVKMIEDQRQQIGIASRCEVLGVRYKK